MKQEMTAFLRAVGRAAATRWARTCCSNRFPFLSSSSVSDHDPTTCAPWRKYATEQ